MVSLNMYIFYDQFLQYSTSVTPSVTQYDVKILVPRTPLGHKTVNFSYLGFLRSVLGYPKSVGPVYGLSEHLCLILGHIGTIQCWCDIYRDVK